MEQKIAPQDKTAEEEKAVDHRRIGLDQKLFFFNELSPGSCFFLPHGALIYNRLVELIRAEYKKRGFKEVITPNIYNCDLWKTSGHYEVYKENMFLLKIEEKEFGLKPMNCPGHCVMFDSQLFSYRDLPLRYADFGVLHRNEFSGALSGLSRVRRFQQDDAHIFCRADQIESEIDGCLDFLKHIYEIFHFEFELCLSTRPEKFIGQVADWDRAEKMLKNSLDRFGRAWTLNEGDGAFYGPKIDIHLKDSLGRKCQCATIQLDFQLPQRFNLKFKAEEGFEQPVMIHRAILGSVERMISILTEHTKGRWPFWLSPRQVMVIPVSAKFLDYAKQIARQLNELANLNVEVDESDEQLGKKIREAQLLQFNFVLVVGQKELDTKTVNLRARDQVENQPKGQLSLDECIKLFKQLTANFN